MDNAKRIIITISVYLFDLKSIILLILFSKIIVNVLRLVMITEYYMTFIRNKIKRLQ